ERARRPALSATARSPPDPRLTRHAGKSHPDWPAAAAWMAPGSRLSVAPAGQAEASEEPSHSLSVCLLSFVKDGTVNFITMFREVNRHLFQNLTAADGVALGATAATLPSLGRGLLFGALVLLLSYYWLYYRALAVQSIALLIPLDYRTDAIELWDQIEA